MPDQEFLDILAEFGVAGFWGIPNDRIGKAIGCLNAILPASRLPSNGAEGAYYGAVTR